MTTSNGVRINLNIKGNIYNLMRRAGYYFERQEGDELVFSRPLSGSGSGYPRFHAYVSRETPKESKLPTGQALEINLHLDQKKPVYKGAPAHAAEYKGELVEKEAERIKQVMEREGITRGPVV